MSVPESREKVIRKTPHERMLDNYALDFSICIIGLTKELTTVPKLDVAASTCCWQEKFQEIPGFCNKLVQSSIDCINKFANKLKEERDKKYAEAIHKKYMKNFVEMRQKPIHKQKPPILRKTALHKLFSERHPLQIS